MLASFQEGKWSEFDGTDATYPLWHTLRGKNIIFEVKLKSGKIQRAIISHQDYIRQFHLTQKPNPPIPANEIVGWRWAPETTAEILH